MKARKNSWKLALILPVAIATFAVANADENDTSVVLGDFVAGPDYDGDGVPSELDLDDDDDRISDIDEGLVDANNDGIPDATSRDTDGDGVVDAIDDDSDNDGILDWDEASGDFTNNIVTPSDTDNDGTPDYLDLDSDGDGIFDIVEAGGVDVDNDGRVDNFVDTNGKGIADSIYASNLPVFDTDLDTIRDFRDPDSDNDAIPDSVEAPNGAVPADFDGDGAPDYRETDSDGDGIPDSVEAGSAPATPADFDNDGEPNYRDLDSDADTIPDMTEAGTAPATPLDTDSDGDPDYLDLDSDNDSVPDSQTVPVPSPLTSGPDEDGDGVPNQLDLDDDNDGIPDTIEGNVDADNNGVADAGSTDTDGDGVPDVYDLDSDNDGILDNQEARYDQALVESLDQVVNGAIDIGVAIGANGLADQLETFPDSGLLNYTVVDTDGDGIQDFRDIDSDGDSIKDLIEAGGGDVDDDGRIDNFADGDGKGVDDFIQGNALPIFDTDGDGQEDFRDLDSDSDTIPDSVEAGPIANQPVDTDGDGAADYREQDSDGDTIPDNVEAGNTPSTPADTDLDGTPDFQDLDSDNDSIPDAQEPSTPPAPPFSTDVDGDGISNDVDIDDDNDGILDVNEGTGDADSDGVANQYDLDSDNDGLFDIQEAAVSLNQAVTLDVNNDGVVDGNLFGSNGFADPLETLAGSGVANYALADTDNDGIPDFLDIDSDNDSLFDAIESGHPDGNVDGRIDFSSAVTQQGVVANIAGGPYVDSDRDGIVDFRDLDSDNDGLTDIAEALSADADNDGRIDNFTDANSDGANDAQLQSPVIAPDTDNDGIEDFRDLDSDNDGLSDLLESDGPQNDLGNDGVIDGFADANGDGRDDGVAAAPIVPFDRDGDGDADYRDLDSDNDGLSDLLETLGNDADVDGVIDPMRDTDGDGIPDSVDVSQTNGTDADFDSIDDAFDADFNGGGDADGDGIVDSADPDADGDGFAGIVDDGASSNQNLPDSDGDGILDFQEIGNDTTTVIAGELVETGLSGTGFGCSIAPAGSQNNRAVDPLFLLLIVAAAGWLLRRRLRTPIVTLAALPLLSSCSMLGLDGLMPSFGGGNGGNASVDRRVYVGVGAGASQLEPDTEGVPGTQVTETASAGGQFTVGMDVSNRLSFEAHGGVLGEAELSTPFTNDATIGYTVGGLSGLFYALNDAEDRGRREGFNLFGRLGVGTMTNQGDQIAFERLNDFHLLAGLGLEYGFRSSGLAARAELISFDEDAQMAQLGLIYRMGEKRDRSTPQVLAPQQPAALPAPAPAPAPVPASPRDTDNDGVADAFDSCPTSVAGTAVDARGCALFNGVIEGVNFESGSANLTADATVILDGVAATLQQFPDVRVTIEAHTDNQGTARSNLDLSKQRAISVARFLVERGIAGNRLRPQAFGESKPRVSNATSEGRARNRRVEFNQL